MATRPALAPNSAAHNASTEAATGVQSTVRVEPAANDDTAKTAFSIHGDPLFGMAIASAILFAVLAALIAMS